MPPGSAQSSITASTAGGGYPERLSRSRSCWASTTGLRPLNWVSEHPTLTNNPYGFSKECAQVLTLNWQGRWANVEFASTARAPASSTRHC